jgi:hypothetical protein
MRIAIAGNPARIYNRCLLSQEGWEIWRTLFGGIAMESASQTISLDHITDLVVEKLTQSGTLANLGSASLEAIEEETIINIDQITRDVISRLLGKQAKIIETPAQCPKCGGEVGEKPAQGRSMQSCRGNVHFKTGVVHCEACRLDFFPSV